LKILALAVASVVVVQLPASASGTPARAGRAAQRQHRRDRLDQDRGPPYPVLHAGPALTPALGVATGDAGAGTTTLTETLTLAT